jgi:hypothetical protein
MGSKKKQDPQSAIAGAAAEQSRQSMEYAKAKLEGREPTLEELAVKEFEKYKLAGELSPEQLARTEFESVSEDPRYLRAKMAALSDLEKRAKVGLTPEEMSRIADLREQTLSDERAQQAAMVQQMAERGALDSGAQLAAQLAGSQQGTQRRLQQARQNAADINTARQQAMGQMANVAQGFSQADLQRQAQQAQAKDTLNQYNAQQRYDAAIRNLGGKQNIMSQNTAQENQRRLQNIDARQQQYQNLLSQTGAITGAQQQYANSLFNQARLTTAPQKTNWGQVIGTAAGAGLGSFAGPMGAMAGAQVGGTVGGQFKDGGLVKAQDGMVTPSLADMQQVDRMKMQSGVTQGEAIDNIAERNDVASELVKAEDQAAADQKMKDMQTYGQIAGGLADALSPKAPVNRAGADIDLSKPNIDWSAPNIMKGKSSMMAQYGAAPQFAQGGFLKAEDGAVEHDGSGDVVPGQSFAGDKVDARVNSGEMVLNLEQQERLNQLLQDYKRLKTGKRVDEQVDGGEKQVNENQQDALMSVVKGEADVTELPESPVLEDMSLDELKKLMLMLGEE